MYSIFNFVKQWLGYKDSKYKDESEDEDYLDDEILNLEIDNYKYNESSKAEELSTEILKEHCFERSGIITYTTENYVLIDGMLYFECDPCSLHLYVNDTVTYIGYRNEQGDVKVLRILLNQGLAWGDENNEEKILDIIQHVIIGEVNAREGRYVCINDSNLKFSLDDIKISFVPIKGDWLELSCNVHWNEDNPSNITANQVVEVLTAKPLRTMMKTAVVTYWNSEYGICDSQIYFDESSFSCGFVPGLRSKVMVHAIESNQGSCSWRAILMIPDGNVQLQENGNEEQKDIQLSLEIEKTKNITFTHPILFNKISFNQSSSLKITVSNNSSIIHKILKWVVLNKKSDSQIVIKPFISSPIKLFPNESFELMVKCEPKFLGYSKELFVLIFNGFQLKRWIEIDVTHESLTRTSTVTPLKSKRGSMQAMKNILNSNRKSYIPGERNFKPAHFIAVKIGMYHIPQKVWAAVLGNTDQSTCNNDSDDLTRIETHLPCLSADLNINSYADKWHTLLYIEEVQDNLQMRLYDKPKTFLSKFQDFLGLEVEGLSEGKPSLIVGDRVIAKDIWDSKNPEFEGIIHAIKGNMLLLKFNRRFHETYTGYDMCIQFQVNRSPYRKCHHAINMAISQLGHNVLIPQRISCHPSQFPAESLSSIKWYNEKLNDKQKYTIQNILLGVCRPLPYCVYGPPGTGKTITVVETILQILKLLPNSRILVATPSNSAANVITERLVDYKNSFDSSMIRLIANYLLDSNSLSDKIKPFCATMDLATENSAKCAQNVKNGINVQCRSNFVGRHKVTIATCVCLGTLVQMGLPKGHFTHVIVDEAGQATEPEIMIPLTFIDKDRGQIILAGDPMQLGPVVLSKYCKEFGMGESYLERILQVFPYKRDVAAFKEDGFDKRLVTRLVDNYRSLENVLTMPSELFYNNTLVPKRNCEEPRIKKLLDDLEEIYPQYKRNGGLYIYGIRGQNHRSEDSPSWFNPQEALMVLMASSKLYQRNVSPDEIGIITPYIAQLKYLKALFESTGVCQPKIGTVEEFQGQERPIILISTVRSSEGYIEDDVKHSLGFVRHPKRINVAITRGQVAVVVYCNPHLLYRDSMWCKIIDNSVRNNCYTGCDLPASLTKYNDD